MNKFFLIGVTVLAVSCAHQYHPALNDVKGFFAQLDDSVLTKKRFLLIDSVTTNLGAIFKQPAQKDSFLSDYDIEFILKEMHNVKSGVWTNAVFDSALIIAQHQIDSIAAPDPFMKTPPHYSFSMPYFNKQRNYCILIYYNYCGNLCSEESIRLYKKDKDRWVFIKSYFSMVS